MLSVCVLKGVGLLHDYYITQRQRTWEAGVLEPPTFG